MIGKYMENWKSLQGQYREWVVEFLERDGLGTLLNRLRSTSGKSMTDTIAQLQCVECLRAVVKSGTGLHYISTHLEYSSYLASAVLVCNNTTVKLQVYELMCALCMFSPDGLLFVRELLSHIKIKQALRHDFEIVVLELQQADTFAYQTTLMAFVNCLILVEQNLRKRMYVRNEFLALGLRAAIEQMAGYEDDALQIQITAFEEHQLADENQAPKKSYGELFDDLLPKISNTLYDSYLHNILLELSEMNYSDKNNIDIWNLINEVVCKDPKKILELYRKTTNTHSTGCQTDEKRLNKPPSLNAVRRHSLDISKDKRTNIKTKRQSLPSLKHVNGSDDNVNAVGRPVKSPILCSISTQTDSTFCCNGNERITGVDFCAEPKNNNCQEPTRKSTGLCEISTAIQAPSSSPLPLTSISIIPPPPPLPSITEMPTQSAIPPPPPLPTLSGIPPPPPLPTLFTGIPPPPPLPTQSGIPPPPPFPGQSAIPPPPPPPFPVSSGIPPPPPPPPFPSTGTSAPPPPPLPGIIPPPPPPALSSMKDLEFCGTKFAALNITDGRRTMPTKRIVNDIKFGSLPRTKMKILNWTKVNNQYLDKSVWSSANPSCLNNELYNIINFEKIDELFCQKPRAKSSPAILSSNGALKPSVVNILDSKRSLAINIMLKQFKTGSKEILEALENGGTTIPVEKLKGLQQVLPTDDEIKKIKKHTGDPASLGTAEQFCLKLSDIVNYHLKIKLIIEKEEMPITVSDIRGQLNSVKEMCQNLIEDQPFKQFLSLVLLVGNYLNAGSYAGNASGFTLDTLPKLLDTRANKPRMTFLHFVVEMAQNNAKDILSFTKYTSTLRSFSRMSWPTLEKQIVAITRQIRSLHSELTKKTTKKQNASLYAQFSDFVNTTVADVEMLNEEFQNVTDVIGRLAVHFGEEVKKFNVDECFALLGNFFERIDLAAKENVNRRIQEEKNQMLANKMEKEKDSPDAKRRVRRVIRPKDEEVCIVDLVLQDIKRGSFNLRSVKSQGEKHI